MKILRGYVARSYVTAFLLAMVVLTFVLSIGLLVKATQLVVKGLPIGMLAKFLLVSIPESFTFTIPLAALVSALLVFGRLSADGEVAAMRACGVNLWSVIAPLALFGAMLTLLTFFVNSYIAPRGNYERHVISSSANGRDALKLLEPGHFINDFPGTSFYFAHKNGDELEDVIILDNSKPGFTREIRAKTAVVSIVEDDMRLDMRHVRIDPFSEKEPGVATAGRLEYLIRNAVKTSVYRPKVGGFSNKMLVDGIRELGAGGDAVAEGDADGKVAAEEAIVNARKLSEYKTELSRRYALSLTPIAFLLIGVPLGIKTRRRESNIGIAVSLSIMLVYYAFLVMAKSLSKHPECVPWIVVWMPSMICLVTSTFLLKKNL